MINKISKPSINSFCSFERMEKFVNKICVFDLSFMERSITGKVVEINPNYILLEMRDGRLLCARLDTILGFGMVKNQPVEAV